MIRLAVLTNGSAGGLDLMDMELDSSLSQKFTQLSA